MRRIVSHLSHLQNITAKIWFFSFEKKKLLINFIIFYHEKFDLTKFDLTNAVFGPDCSLNRESTLYIFRIKKIKCVIYFFVFYPQKFSEKVLNNIEYWLHTIGDIYRFLTIFKWILVNLRKINIFWQNYEKILIWLNFVNFNFSEFF